MLHDVNGWIVFRFHARDLRLVIGPSSTRRQHAIPGTHRRTTSRVRPTEQMLTKTGYGTPGDQRLYQLIRQRDPSMSTFEVTFLNAGVQAHVFTFG